MMFVNQTVVSSILVVALYRGGVGYERIADALIGGCLAIIFAALLFPADPLTVLRRARVAGWARCTVCCLARRISPPGAGNPRPTGPCRPWIGCTNRSVR